MPRRPCPCSAGPVAQQRWSSARRTSTDRLGGIKQRTVGDQSRNHRREVARGIATRMHAFFINEVRSRLDAPLPSGADGALRVLIVLSGAGEFESGEDLQPIQAGAAARLPGLLLPLPHASRDANASAMLPMPGRRQHGRGMLGTFPYSRPTNSPRRSSHSPLASSTSTRPTNSVSPGAHARRESRVL